MSDKKSRLHNGAGGNIPGGIDKSTSGGRPRQQKDQPQAATSSSIDEYHSANSLLDDEDASMPGPFLSDSQLADFHEALADSERRSGLARKRAQSTQAEQERQRRSLQPRIKTTPNTTIPSSISRNEDRSTAPPATSPSSPLSPTSSEDWENLLEPTSTTPLQSTPPFPGTWSAALHDTTAALTQVSYASRSFGAALTKSGIGKASRSVGTAALSSTNQAALAAASWGIKKTGIMPNELPRTVARWITEKEGQDRRRRRVEERRRRRGGFGYEHALKTSFRDEQGEFGVVLHEMDNRGEFKGRGPLDMREAARSRETEMDGRAGDTIPECERGEYEESADEAEQGDGLIRLFEYDDEDDYL